LKAYRFDEIAPRGGSVAKLVELRHKTTISRCFKMLVIFMILSPA